MHEDICNAVVDSIVTETVSSLPNDVLSFYRNLPGRKLSETSKKISRLLSNMDDQTALELIVDIVDRSVFSILYLIDNDFKDQKIGTVFTKESLASGPDDCRLVERYRDKVEPNGIVSKNAG